MQTQTHHGVLWKFIKLISVDIEPPRSTSIHRASSVEGNRAIFRGWWHPDNIKGCFGKSFKYGCYLWLNCSKNCIIESLQQFFSRFEVVVRVFPLKISEFSESEIGETHFIFDIFHF